MNKVKALLLLVSALVTLALVPSAHSAPPIAGGGTFIQISNTLNAPPRVAAGNTFFSLTTTFLDTGTLSGTEVDVFTFVTHPDGNTTFHGTATFTGDIVVGGSVVASGTSQFVLEGTGEGASFEGALTIQSGTGGLANLRGHGTFVGTLGVGGTYTLDFHFEP
jgi:hypothetical protein